MCMKTNIVFCLNIHMRMYKRNDVLRNYSFFLRIFIRSQYRQLAWTLAVSKGSDLLFYLTLKHSFNQQAPSLFHIQDVISSLWEQIFFFYSALVQASWRRASKFCHTDELHLTVCLQAWENMYVCAGACQSQCHQCKEHRMSTWEP